MGQTLRAAVIGTGGMGRGHVRGLKAQPGVEIVAACDRDEKRLSAVADEFDVPHRYTDEKALLREQDVDLVCVVTPNAFHARQTIAALRAGCHVLCDKPMAVAVREAERMVEAARKARRNLMINFSYRFSPMSYALKRQVDDGVIGEIYFGRTVWHRRRGMPGFGGWFGIKELSGGGPLIDLGVHRLDLALWLMGYPDPVTVTGSTYNEIAGPIARRQRKKFDVEDLACGIVRFDNGATLIIEASWALNQPEREHMVTQLCGTKGGLVQKNVNQGYEFVAEVYTEEGGALFTKKLDWTTASCPGPWEEFVASVREKRQPMATGEEGLKVMKILEGIYKSAQTGREVRYRR